MKRQKLNRIIIAYSGNEGFVWDGNFFDDINDTLDYLINEICLYDFDLIETVLDIDTYKKLYYEFSKK